MVQALKEFFARYWGFLIMAVIVLLVFLVGPALVVFDKEPTITVMSLNDVKVAYVASTHEAFLIDLKTNKPISILDAKVTDAIYIYKSAERAEKYLEATTTKTPDKKPAKANAPGSVAK